jgi:hypothetical protein
MLKLRPEMPLEDIAGIDIAPYWSAWHEIASKPVGLRVARETADQPYYSGGDREYKPDHQEPQEIPKDRPCAWCSRI